LVLRGLDAHAAHEFAQGGQLGQEGGTSDAAGMAILFIAAESHCLIDYKAIRDSTENIIIMRRVRRYEID